VRTLNDHFKSEPEPPDLRPSSNIDFPVAWITGPATDPSLAVLDVPDKIAPHADLMMVRSHVGQYNQQAA
jgi:hypothetical protein